MSRFRVLLLADTLSVHTERIARELRRQGCRVVPASLEHGDLCHVHLRKYTPVRQLRYILSSLQIRKIVRKFRPNVINAHFATGYGFVAALARVSPGVPIALNLWGSDILVAPQRSHWSRWKASVALRAASAVFADSEYLLDSATQLESIDRGEVIPWGIERTYLALHRPSYTLSTPLRVIVPRLHEPIYNNAFILKALVPLVKEGRACLTFPAFGSGFERFRREATAISGNGIRFYERLPRRDFLRFLAEHDVYLSAALSDSSPASLIEAMALGLIPVAADIPGVREWLTKETGFTFVQNDSESLCSVFHQLIAENDNHETIRRRNLEIVQARGVFEDNVAAQLAVMKDIAGWSGRSQ